MKMLELIAFSITNRMDRGMSVSLFDGGMAAKSIDEQVKEEEKQAVNEKVEDLAEISKKLMFWKK